MTRDLLAASSPRRPSPSRLARRRKSGDDGRKSAYICRYARAGPRPWRPQPLCLSGVSSRKTPVRLGPTFCRSTGRREGGQPGRGCGCGWPPGRRLERRRASHAACSPSSFAILTKQVPGRPSAAHGSLFLSLYSIVPHPGRQTLSLPRQQTRPRSEAKVSGAVLGGRAL